MMIQAIRPKPASAVRSHLQALEISSRLTAYFRRKHRPMATHVTPERVIEVLNEVGIKPVLMGAHGLGGWRSQSRSTEDVDVLVRKKDIRKAVRALQAAYPMLTITDFPVVTRFTDPATKQVVIDVMKPTQEVFKVVFRHTIRVGETHEIPDLEMALASKFAAMVSPRRVTDKKLLDGADFVNVVVNNRSDIGLPKLRRLAEKVYPNGGGAEIMQLIADIDAGRMIRF
jgi:hypothetical protein